MIYLDHAATTPLDPRAKEAMLPWLDCANPSSQHAAGREARMAIDAAREQVAEAMNCLPGEVMFTSSGTEAAVTAIIGAARANLGGTRKRVLMGAAEHHAVLHCEKQLRELGYSVDHVPPTSAGAMDVGRLEVTDDVLLVAAMQANNETGAVTDADTVAEKCAQAGALFFCDAVQTFGKLPLPDADLIAVSAHKAYGPKGVGALRVRAGAKIEQLMAGGGQERELRGGTENVAGIVGFGVVAGALATTSDDDWFLPDEQDFLGWARFQQARIPRDTFLQEVAVGILDAVVTVKGEPCLPGHAHLRIPGISAEVILINLDRLGVAASSGAACSSGSIEPSHVLIATGLTEKEAAEGLRFTFGRDATEGEAVWAAQLLFEAVNAAQAR